MKITIALCGVAVFLAGTYQSRADILAGPFINPANGHEYYLLTPDTWSASETEAETLGGTLAVIRNPSEQSWIFAKFGTYEGRNLSLWLGFHRQSPGGPFISVTGETMGYTDWAPGQPDNSGGQEDCVQIWANGPYDGQGLWNDARNNDTSYGLVETTGKWDQKSLNKEEKSLIGTWYETGHRNNPCWITGTASQLFQIYDGRAVRLVVTGKDSLFLLNGIHGNEVKGVILWSNGTWWSREPEKDPSAGYPDGTAPEVMEH